MIHLPTYTHSRDKGIQREVEWKGGGVGGVVLPKGVFSSLLIARFGLNTKINLIKRKAKIKLQLRPRFSFSFLVSRFSFLAFQFCQNFV